MGTYSGTVGPGEIGDTYTLNVEGKQVDFYVAFGYWKLACILEGVYAELGEGADEFLAQHPHPYLPNRFGYDYTQMTEAHEVLEGMVSLLDTWRCRVIAASDTESASGLSLQSVRFPSGSRRSGPG